MQNENNLLEYPIINNSEKHNYINKINDWNKYHDDEHKLDVYHIAIYQYLLRNANSDKGYAFPSLNDIMMAINVSKRKVIYTLKELEDYGFIIRDKGFDGRNTRYYFIHYNEMGNLWCACNAPSSACDAPSSACGDTLKEYKKNNKKNNKRKEEVANAPLSPDGDSESVSVLLKNLNIKENDKNKRLITNRIKNKDSFLYIEKIITETEFYDWINTKEYTCDTHKLNTALKYILDEADKRYNKNNPCNNTLFYGRYTKEEVDNFRLNLSMGEMYPELLEFIQIEQNYNSF